MRILACAFAAVIGLSGAASAATITALNEASVVGTAPAEVANRINGNDDGITVGFNEQSGVTLGSDMTLGGIFFAAGTTVDSHLLYHDRKSPTPVNDYYTSLNSFSFSETILAVIMTTSELNATHVLFGAVGSDYLSAYGWFGLEKDEQEDAVVTENTFSGRFTVNGGFDAVRVLTAPATVPLPASGLMLLGALGGLAMSRRNRR